MSEYTEELEIEFDLLYFRAVQEAREGNWTMRDGTTIHVTKMTDSHIRNCIAMLERNWSPFAEPFLVMFKKEQERRTNEANGCRFSSREMQ